MDLLRLIGVKLKELDMKRLLAYLLTFLIILPQAVFAAEDIDSVLDSSIRYMLSSVPEPTVSSIGGEWMIIGAARSGYEIPEEYYQKYYDNLKAYLDKNHGVLHERKYTEYSRVILALTAIGKNPSDAGGYNLLLPLGDYEKTVFQGLNGAVWALIALDCGNYDIPQNDGAAVKASRAMYTEQILSLQKGDGGWGLSAASDSDADITAMAVCSLAKYRAQPRVQTAVDAAVEFLSARQNENGGYLSGNTENAETAAQVITALCALKIPVDDKRFVKNGKTLYDNLMEFYTGNGFSHERNGAVNQMATEQGVYALAALKRFEQGNTPLWDMTDVVKKDSQNNNNNTEDRAVLPENSLKTFDDIADIKERKQIEALAERKIINGRTETEFEPYATMTRAEFTAVITRSLDLTPSGSNNFDDVKGDDWFYGYVSAACDNKIVTGVSLTEFNPYGVITKEEAAVMIARSAKLCGMNTEYAQTRDILSEFTDYTTVSGWAESAMAFCYDNQIISNEETEINPWKNVTRAEIAVMLYNVLRCTGRL